MNTKTSETFVAGSLVNVLLPLPLSKAYDYQVPLGMTLLPGSLVRVPFGPRSISGVVWGYGEGEINPKKLKTIIKVHDCPPLPDVTRSFIEWVSRYTLQMPGAVLKMVISAPDALEPPQPTVALTFAKVPEGLRITSARQLVLNAVSKAVPKTTAEIARKTGVSRSVINGLVEAGALVPVSAPPVISPPPPNVTSLQQNLSDEQLLASSLLSDAAKTGDFRVILIDGVPGSGKTEVYFQALAQVLRSGRQVLVLLPEISLSAQWLDRFRRRFGTNPVEWHSDLTKSQRRNNWRAVAEGYARVVVGARSALFLPFPDLGLIVVDEEHEAAFKQEDGVIYNGRDMAVVRAQLSEISIALVSATPSLETVVNADQGRYERVRLETRHAGAVMPEISVIDLLKTPPEPGNWLSPTLRDNIAETLEDGEQALLFLNRRGYAPLTLCRRCGHRFQCPNCSAWLVEHRLANRLQCHHCGHNSLFPARCPSCDAEDSFVACGPGVERLAEELNRRFPNARTIIAASDSINSPRKAAELVAQIENHQIDIVIGTQMVAKGYHFPLLTLVGAVDADLGLQGGDLRAAERTYQLLYQLAGRAGRETRPGRVLLQTYMAQHPVIKALAAGDREKFLSAEQDARRALGMPPFGRLVALIISSANELAVEQVSMRLGRTAPQSNEIQVLGPAPAPFAILRGRHRRRLLLKATREVNVQAAIKNWLSQTDYPKTVRVQVDIDPYNFL